MNEIQLFGTIGAAGLTAAEIKAKLASFDQSQQLTVRFDSPGGSVLAGASIFTAFRDYPGPKKAIVESAAFSIASYLLTAFDDVEITDNGYVMIHNPSLKSEGDDEEHARDAKLLADLKQDMAREYSRKMGVGTDQVFALMKATTYYNAAESVRSGFASRIKSHSAPSRFPSAFNDSMPYRVVASLRCDKPQIDSSPTLQEPQMSEPKTSAASIDEIQAAFPTMSSDFVLGCIKKSMPMAQVATAAAEQITAENSALKAEVEAMKKENAEMKAEQEAIKAKAMDEDAEAEKAKAEAAEAKALASGNQPVAVGVGGVKSHAEEWRAAIDAEKSIGKTGAAAVSAANKKNPGLRAKFLAEVN